MEFTKPSRKIWKSFCTFFCAYSVGLATDGSCTRKRKETAMMPAQTQTPRKPTVPPPGRKLSFKEAQERLYKKYGKTLKMLAK